MTWTKPDLIVKTAENPVDIANLLNRYFYSVFNHDYANDEDSIPIFSEDYSTLPETISDIALTETEVCSVLRTLNEEKATGPDKILQILLHLFVIYSSKAYHLVYCPRGGIIKMPK